MSTYLTEEIRTGLRPAQDRPGARPTPGRRARAAPLTVRAGGRSWRVLRRVPGGFTLAAEDAPRLRGLVDLYEGERHAMHCLVVGAELDGVEARFEFKRATPARDAAPLDFFAGA